MSAVDEKGGGVGYYLNENIATAAKVSSVSEAKVCVVRRELCYEI